ncbi:MAG: hypothetical protein V1872_02875 [bacterium]
MLGLCLGVLFVVVSAGMTFAGTVYFPDWEQKVASTGLAVSTWMFVHSTAADNTVTITCYNAAGDDSKTTTNILGANEQWVCDSSSWLTGTGFNGATGGYQNGAFNFGGGKIVASGDQKASAFVDIFFTNSGTPVCGYSIPLLSATANKGGELF